MSNNTGDIVLFVKLCFWLAVLLLIVGIVVYVIVPALALSASVGIAIGFVTAAKNFYLAAVRNIQPIRIPEQ